MRSSYLRRCTLKGHLLEGEVKASWIPAIVLSLVWGDLLNIRRHSETPGSWTQCLCLKLIPDKELGLLRLNELFFPVLHRDKYSFSLKSYLPTVQGKRSKSGLQVGKSLFALYLSCKTSMSYPLWTHLAVSEQGSILKNTLLFSRFLLPSQLEHASSSPFPLGLVQDTRMTMWERLCWLGALWVRGPCSQGRLWPARSTCGDGSSHLSVS